MPESIAVVKLRGFVSDLGGEVIDSEPGLIHVRLPGPAGAQKPKSSGLLGWLGLSRNPPPVLDTVAMELHLDQKPGADNHLLISVCMRAEQPSNHSPAQWNEWTAGVVRTLRGYLMGR